jgi:hypothetical protein
MALKGHLRDFSVAQLLNLINLAKKSGTLTLEAPDEVAWVSFTNGRLNYAQLVNEDGTLTGILTRNGRLNPRQVKLIQSHATNMVDKELGLLLINSGYLTQKEILESIRKYVLDIIFQLFTWTDGYFRFDPDLKAPEDRITLRMDLENIIIEGSRHVREAEQLQEEIPNLDMALNFVERAGANIKDINLNATEWKVVNYINPKNSMRQIGKALKMSDFEIRRVAFGLLQAGLVEIVRPEGMPPPPQARRIKPVDKERQVSLVNRLMQRIRSL